jgi:methylated-DNA-[protein]-cysteine S-methyltransferase
MSTEFESLVYEKVSQIPKGQISTYKQVAFAIGKPNASRAVGQALAKNPYSPQVPCHRVISTSGLVKGFFGSTESERVNKKISLLQAEGIPISNDGIINKIDLQKLGFISFK